MFLNGVVKNHVGGCLPVRALAQSRLQHAISDQEDLDIVAMAAPEFRCRVKNSVEAIGDAVRSGEQCQPVRVSYAFRPPRVRIGRKNVSIPSVGYPDNTRIGKT